MQVAAELLVKFAWLHVVPWSMVRADTAVGATAAYIDLHTADAQALDPLSLHYKATLLPALRQVMDGSPAPAALCKEIGALQNVPLDESLGESWHRASNLTFHKASRSRQPWILSSVRMRQSMDRCRQWVTKRGKRGRDVFRFEWRKHKRVLQFRSKRRFQPCKLPHHRFYRKLYRLDAPSDD